MTNTLPTDATQKRLWDASVTMTCKERFLKHLILILTVLCFNIIAQAQQKGNIIGKVVDKATKQPLIGANVIVVGTTQGASTNNDGMYLIKGLDEDVYTLLFRIVGYASSTETDVRVVRNKTTQVKEIELEETILQTEGVAVTTGLFREDRRAPVSNYSYAREEIRRSPGATGDVFRAIETLPGVSSSGGEFSAFSVRGGSPRDNIVLVDNIPFDKVSHFDGGTSEEQEAQGGRFSIFAPGLIDEANFQAGGFSARYGGKNASFVDLKVKDGNNETLTVNGTYDLIGWEVNYDGPSYVLGATSLLLSARYQDFKNVLDLTGQKDLGYPRFADVIVKTTTDIDRSNRISLLAIVAPEKFDRTIDHVFEGKDLDQIDLVKLDESKNLLGLNWRTLTGTNSFLLTTAYYSHKRRNTATGHAYPDRVNGELPEKSEVYQRPDIYVEANKEIETGVKLAFTSMFGTSRLTSGVEIARVNLNYRRTQNGLDTVYIFDRDDYRSDLSQFFTIRRPEFVNSTVTDRNLTGAAYVEYSGAINEELIVTPGLRYEFSEFNRKSYISPRISASYRFSPEMAFNVAGGVYYQAPEYQIIAAHSMNTSLGHERAYHLITGLTRSIGDDIKLTVEAYYKQFENMIIRPDRTTAKRVNAGKGWASGVDIGLVKRFEENWYGQVNYSYAQSKRNDSNGEGWYNSDFNQPHIFNILVGYQLNKEWSFSTKWKYATGRPKDSYVVHADVFNTPDFVRYSKEIMNNNAERLDNFHTLNVRIDYRKQLGPVALLTYLDILNLYNRLNVNEERFLELTGEEQKRGFEILPTFGFKLEL